MQGDFDEMVWAVFAKLPNQVLTRFVFILLIPGIIQIYVSITSSTAQGGGGSFKNRKPIGEIGCCESPMAEQKH